MRKQISEIINFINEFSEPDSSQLLAYVTHYFQNKNLGSEKYYNKDRIHKFLKDNHYKKAKIKTIIEAIFKSDLEIVFNVPFPPVKNHYFTFIDLFAGIGGFRISFQNLRGKCVFSSEWDINSQKTYEANFGEIPFGDITAIKEKDIPDHDLLLAGFPCQAFSIAGRKGGFEDTRGTLFFDIARILKEKKPKAFFLENVKGLMHHDRGKTIETIINVLRNDLKYYVPDPQTVNAKDFGLPQKRERVYIIGFRPDQKINSFTYPKPIGKKVFINEILEENSISSKYYLSSKYLETLRKHKKRHELKGNGFGFEILDEKSIANAIVVGGMGKERNLIIDKRLIDFEPVTNIKGCLNREYVRRMTPKEWARLQGFPDKFIIPVSDTQAYKQFGNSLAIPAVEALGKKILELIYGI